MKKKNMCLVLSCLIAAALLLVSCAPSVTEEEEAIPEVASPKKITLDDAPDILNLTPLLPARFEHLDAASEGMSNEDMGLGPDVSEVQLFFSENPFQMIYCALGIEESRIEQAGFDRQLEDEYQIKAMLENALKEGAAEEGMEITVPIIEITYPDIGDSALLGEGYMESYGFQYGFDILWFRSNTVIVFLTSMYMSSDKVPLLPIAQEIEKRLNNYEH